MFYRVAFIHQKKNAFKYVIKAHSGNISKAFKTI